MLLIKKSMYNGVFLRKWNTENYVIYNKINLRLISLYIFKKFVIMDTFPQ